MLHAATIGSWDDLIEALRGAKDTLGLSNAWCDEIGGLTRGHTDKALGPTRAKGLSPMLFDTFLKMFAIRLRIEVDIDQVKAMEARWEGRDRSNVRTETGRVSKKLIQRAKPHVMKACAAAGGRKTQANRTESERSEAGKKAAKARGRLPKKVRSEISRKGWIKRRQRRNVPACVATKEAAPAL